MAMGKLFICVFLLGYSFSVMAQAGRTETRSKSGKYGIWWRDKYDYKPKKSKWVLDPEYDSIIDASSGIHPYRPVYILTFVLYIKTGRPACLWDRAMESMNSC